MAVKVRMARAGTRNSPFFRIVVADERAPRNGAFLELVGTYDPREDPAAVTLKMDRVDYWLAQGAQTTKTVAELIHRQRVTEN
jgi:small subunit ribosomal protein S16